MENIVIIGAGASGMMAALTAAEDKENHVILVERQQRPGRKLLATGNGRCNLTNTGASEINYHGEQEGFVCPALEGFTPEDALCFFHDLGLVTVEEYGGRVYPLSQSANSVLDVLRYALEKAGVELKCSACVRQLRRSGNGYEVLTDEDRIYADKLIMACGGAAGSKLGGVMDGYELMKDLGHKRTSLYPALVQIKTKTDYPKALKGVRADGGLRLLCGGETAAESRGEIQFTETGISGPAAFDISRAVSTGGKGLKVEADFMCDYPESDVVDMLKKRRAALPELSVGEVFVGMLHNRLGRMLVKYAGLDGSAPLSSLKEGDIAALCAAVKHFTLEVEGTEGFDCAQVTAGGLKTTAFNPQTLESWFMPGLFACGEVLDVDGDCGGYNLQWAWASGRLAGRLGK